MRSFLKAIILLPIAIVMVLLAVANRAPVLLSFDPFSANAPELSLTVPLYWVLFAAMILGVLIGGIGSWLSQGGTRRGRRHAQREVKRLKAETERMRAAAAHAGVSGGALGGLPALTSAQAR